MGNSKYAIINLYSEYLTMKEYNPFDMFYKCDNCDGLLNINISVVLKTSKKFVSREAVIKVFYINCMHCGYLNNFYWT